MMTGEDRAEYDRGDRRSDLLPVLGALLLFAGTIAVLAMVLSNLDSAVQGFLDIAALPNEGPFKLVAGFVVVYTIPTLYFLGGVKLWVIAFGE